MLFDQMAVLTAEERENPLQTLNELGTDYKLQEQRAYIFTMIEVCLTSENTEYNEPMQRSDLLIQGRHLLKMVEAAYILSEENP